MSRHDKRAAAAQARRSGGVAAQGHNVFALCASYHGVKGETVKNLFALEHAAQDAGHSFAFDSVDRTPLDLARNETFTKLLASTATAGLFVDDDCQVDPAWLPMALDLLKPGEIEIVTAPCRLRGEKVVFNISPVSPPFDVNGQRLMECSWTGFGCVLVLRDVVEVMFQRYPKLHYRSVKVPGATSCGLFRSDIVPASMAGLEGGSREYMLDDHVWSLRALASGFKIHAAIDARTCHDGYVGCFGETLDAYEVSKTGG